MADDDGVIPLPSKDDTPYGRIHARITKGSDLELHVKLLKIDGQELVNLRDYIPSRNLYGKGVFFPRAQLPEVIAGLKELL